MGEFFGGYVDHFTLATADLILHSDTSKDRPESRADAIDDLGDIAAAWWYGNPSGTIKDVTSTYMLKSGTLDLATLDLGELSTGVFLTSIAVTLGNGQWPIIVATGILGAGALTLPTGYLNTFSLPTMVLTGVKQALPIGFTVTAGCKLTGVSISASCEYHEAPDADGDPAAYGVSGGILTCSADFVAITDVPAWTVTQADATETSPPGNDEPQAAPHTGTGNYELVIDRDAAA